MFVPEITVFGRHNTFYQQRVTTHASSLENAIGKGAFQLFQFNGNFCFRSQALDVVISQLILSRELQFFADILFDFGEWGSDFRAFFGNHQDFKADRRWDHACVLANIHATECIF